MSDTLRIAAGPSGSVKRTTEDDLGITLDRLAQRYNNGVILEYTPADRLVRGYVQVVRGMDEQYYAEYQADTAGGDPVTAFHRRVTEEVKAADWEIGRVNSVHQEVFTSIASADPVQPSGIDPDTLVTHLKQHGWADFAVPDGRAATGVMAYLRSLEELDDTYSYVITNGPPPEWIDAAIQIQIDQDRSAATIGSRLTARRETMQLETVQQRLTEQFEAIRPQASQQLLNQLLQGFPNEETSPRVIRTRRNTIVSRIRRVLRLLVPIGFGLLIPILMMLLWGPLYQRLTTSIALPETLGGLLGLVGITMPETVPSWTLGTAGGVVSLGGTIVAGWLLSREQTPPKPSAGVLKQGITGGVGATTNRPKDAEIRKAGKAFVETTAEFYKQLQESTQTYPASDEETFYDELNRIIDTRYQFVPQETMQRQERIGLAGGTVLSGMIVAGIGVVLWIVLQAAGSVITAGVVAWGPVGIAAVILLVDIGLLGVSVGGAILQRERPASKGKHPRQSGAQLPARKTVEKQSSKQTTESPSEHSSETSSASRTARPQAPQRQDQPSTTTQSESTESAWGVPVGEQDGESGDQSTTEAHSTLDGSRASSRSHQQSTADTDGPQSATTEREQTRRQSTQSSQTNQNTRSTSSTTTAQSSNEDEVPTLLPSTNTSQRNSQRSHSQVRCTSTNTGNASDWAADGGTTLTHIDQITAGNTLYQPVVGEGFVYLPYETGHIDVLWKEDLEAPEQSLTTWDYADVSEIQATPAVGPSGRLFVPDRNGLSVLMPGDTAKQPGAEHHIALSGRPVTDVTLASGDAFVIDSDNQLYRSGPDELKWQEGLKTPNATTDVGPTIAVGTVIAVIWDRQNVDIFTREGEYLAHTETDKRLTGEPVIDDRTLYVRAQQGDVYRYRIGKHGLGSPTRIDGGAPTQIGIGIDDSHLYVPSRQGIQAVDRQRERTDWATRLDTTVATPPVVAGSHLYVGDSSGRMHIFDTASGTQHERQPLQLQSLAYEPVLAGQCLLTTNGSDLEISRRE